jgi:hypothetical protein
LINKILKGIKEGSIRLQNKSSLTTQFICDFTLAAAP